MLVQGFAPPLPAQKCDALNAQPTYLGFHTCCSRIQQHLAVRASWQAYPGHAVDSDAISDDAVKRVCSGEVDWGGQGGRLCGVQCACIQGPADLIIHCIRS